MHPINLGGVPVILEGRNGARFQVDILARDRRPGGKRGIAHPPLRALPREPRSGRRPTREEHGLGVIWLAALLRTRENARHPVRLLTLRERLVRRPQASTSSAPTPGPARPTAPRASVMPTAKTAERSLPEATAALPGVERQARYPLRSSTSAPAAAMGRVAVAVRADVVDVQAVAGRVERAPAAAERDFVR